MRCGSREYRRLDDQHHVYLDYTGGSLHAESQVLEHATLLNEHVFGNPHSASPSSRRHDDARRAGAARGARVVQRAAGRYTAIFTANATGALKHVGESYPFAPGGRGCSSRSTITTRSTASASSRARRARRSTTRRSRVPELRIDRDQLDAMLAAPINGARASSRFRRSRTSPASSIRSS